MEAYRKDRPVTWTDDPLLIQRLLDLVTDSEIYKDYIAAPGEKSMAEDCELWRALLKNVIVPSGDIGADAQRDRRIVHYLGQGGEHDHDIHHGKTLYIPFLGVDKLVYQFPIVSSYELGHDNPAHRDILLFYDTSAAEAAERDKEIPRFAHQRFESDNRRWHSWTYC